MDIAPHLTKRSTQGNEHGQESDFSYWQAQPYHLRLAALEQIRREYHQWKYGAEPILQRIYSIAKQ